MNLQILAKSRLRRNIRLTLDNIATVVSSPRIDHDRELALFSETHCAIITDTADIIVSNTASTPPFEAIVPKIHAIRMAATSLSNTVDANPIQVIHIRGRSRMVHAYLIGKHTLVALTEVSPGARNLDAVVARVDKCLTIATNTPTLLDHLSSMLEQL